MDPEHVTVQIRVVPLSSNVYTYTYVCKYIPGGPQQAGNLIGRC